MRYSILFILIVCALPAFAQQNGNSPSGSSDRSLSPRENLLGFVRRNASAAGAAAICRPQLYTEIRLCTVLMTIHWEALGQKPPSDRGIEAAIEQTWNQAAGSARNIQAGANSPISCENLITRIASDHGFWQACGAATAIQDKLDEQRRKNGNTPTAPRRN